MFPRQKQKSVAIKPGRKRTVDFMPSGLTFYKNFINGQTIADFAAGVPTGTFLSSRSATNPATYIDANGVIQVSTTSDVPLFDYGYYDATGFHAIPLGYHAYRSSTNLLTRTDGTAYASGLWTGWEKYVNVTGTPTYTNTAIPELTSIAGATSQRYQYTVNAGDSSKVFAALAPKTAAGSVSNGDTITASIWARSLSGQGTIPIFLHIGAEPAGGGEDLSNFNSSGVTLTTSWRRYTFTATMTDATVSRVNFRFGCGNVGTTVQNIDYEFALPQLEKLPYATPFIPTTTAALTRNADVLKYENAGNSTANEETIFIKFTPGSTFANDNIYRVLYRTDTKFRSIFKNLNESGIGSIFPNETDNIGVKVANSTSPVSSNTSYIHCTVFKHSSPYIETYTNGVSKGTYTGEDWTNPAWGTYNYIGLSQSGLSQLDGNISHVVKFNRALSASEISTVSALLN